MKFSHVYKKMLNALLLAGVLSVAAMSAVQAYDGPPTGMGTGNGHASTAPACDTEKCRVFATEGPPTAIGDGNGRSAALVTDTAAVVKSRRCGRRFWLEAASWAATSVTDAL